MPRWVSPIIGVLVLAFGIWLGAHDFRSSPHDASSVLDAGAGAAVAHVAAVTPDADLAPAWTETIAESTPRLDGGAGTTLLDGTPAPPLPGSAPRQVRFGVVLVSYAGAQPSASGGRPATRDRAAAKELATKLTVTAQHDFHVAVQQGDEGSADDLGTVKTGLLEPAPEYVLFTLPPGGVGGPVDTPRGYWVVKRLE